MIWTGKNVKAVFEIKKNQQSKSKFFMFLSKEIYSVCQFLYLHNLLFAFIHYAFCSNSISMSFCWIFSSFKNETLWISFSKFLVTFLVCPSSVLTHWYLSLSLSFSRPCIRSFFLFSFCKVNSLSTASFANWISQHLGYCNWLEG